MTAKESVGKTFAHHNLGTVKVFRVEENSRTKVEVAILDRGKGYDPIKRRYKGYNNSVGWMRGENREFGKMDVVHIKTLKNITHEDKG
tara:strand:- start:434 stop:697 length:264 start_codon:yes stop_codon:yes gene_type:complete